MKNLLSNLKESIAHYAQLRITSLRLEVIDRVSNAMGYFAFMMMVAFLFFFSFLYFSFGLAAWLGDLFNSRYAGMFCTGGIILIIAFVTLLLSKPIVRFFAGKLAAILMRKGSDENDENDENDE